MNAVVGVAVGAVSLVLLAGLFNMLKGGNPNRSQQLMRLRVVMQLAAVILIMAVIWYRGG